jgi:solute carrier family 35 protein F5
MKCGNSKTCTVYYWPDSESYAGDLWAILSAFAYACYGILMKVYVGDGTKTSMSLLFGFIGICNLIFLWPLIIFFRFTHIEPIK